MMRSQRTAPTSVRGTASGIASFATRLKRPRDTKTGTQQVVTSEIAPLLEEYYFDDPERAQSLVERLSRT